MTSPRDLPVVSGGVGGAVNGALVRGGLFDSSHRGNREARPSAAEPDTPSIASLFTGVETEAQNGAVPQRLGPRCCRQLDRCSAPGGAGGGGQPRDASLPWAAGLSLSPAVSE